MSDIIIAPPFPGFAGKSGKCYNNVQEVIRRHGGEAVYGWALADYGPHRVSGWYPPPLYRRWLNHVVWRDTSGMLWEVSPNLNLDNLTDLHHVETEFMPDEGATFEVISDEEWYTCPTRYVAVRREGNEVVDFLTRAQHAVTQEARLDWIHKALAALESLGFTPREWKVETVGERTGSIWLCAE
jgi:hypothetical protein